MQINGLTQLHGAQSIGAPHFNRTTAPAAPTLAPLDTTEIAEARWGTPAELLGPIRERLLATGRALWRYRVALHDAAMAALSED